MASIGNPVKGAFNDIVAPRIISFNNSSKSAFVRSTAGSPSSGTPSPTTLSPLSSVPAASPVEPGRMRVIMPSEAPDIVPKLNLFRIPDVQSPGPSYTAVGESHRDGSSSDGSSGSSVYGSSYSGSSSSSLSGSRVSSYSEDYSSYTGSYSDSSGSRACSYPDGHSSSYSSYSSQSSETHQSELDRRRMVHLLTDRNPPARSKTPARGSRSVGASINIMSCESRDRVDCREIQAIQVAHKIVKAFDKGNFKAVIEYDSCMQASDFKRLVQVKTGADQLSYMLGVSYYRGLDSALSPQKPLYISGAYHLLKEAAKSEELDPPKSRKALAYFAAVSVMVGEFRESIDLALSIMRKPVFLDYHRLASSTVCLALGEMDEWRPEDMTLAKELVEAQLGSWESQVDTLTYPKKVESAARAAAIVYIRLVGYEDLVPSERGEFEISAAIAYLQSGQASKALNYFSYVDMDCLRRDQLALAKYYQGLAALSVGGEDNMRLAAEAFEQAMKRPLGKFLSPGMRHDCLLRFAMASSPFNGDLALLTIRKFLSRPNLISPERVLIAKIVHAEIMLTKGLYRESATEARSLTIDPSFTLIAQHEQNKIFFILASSQVALGNSPAIALSSIKPSSRDGGHVKFHLPILLAIDALKKEKYSKALRICADYSDEAPGECQDYIQSIQFEAYCKLGKEEMAWEIIKEMRALPSLHIPGRDTAHSIGFDLGSIASKRGANPEVVAYYFSSFAESKGFNSKSPEALPTYVKLGKAYAESEPRHVQKAYDNLMKGVNIAIAKNKLRTHLYDIFPFVIDCGLELNRPYEVINLLHRMSFVADFRKAIDSKKVMAPYIESAMNIAHKRISTGYAAFDRLVHAVVNNPYPKGEWLNRYHRLLLSMSEQMLYLNTYTNRLVAMKPSHYIRLPEGEIDRYDLDPEINNRFRATCHYWLGLCYPLGSRERYDHHGLCLNNHPDQLSSDMRDVARESLKYAR